MNEQDNTCSGCGASIPIKEEDCPFCGKSIEKASTIQQDSDAYTTRQTEDGTLHVEFGDGDTGRKLPSGSKNVSAAYRVGGGVADEIKCPRCMTVQKKGIKKCVRCGSPLSKSRWSIRIRRSS